MLLYNKTLDPNHTILRLLSILESFENEQIEKDRLKIFDFLLANPFHIYKLSLPQDYRKSKSEFKKYGNSYNKFEARSLFEHMKPVQEVCINKLIEVNILNVIDKTDRLRISSNNIPESILSIVTSESNSISKPALLFINENLSQYSLLGTKGLKAASNLMEYKYDAN